MCVKAANADSFFVVTGVLGKNVGHYTTIPRRGGG